jgi:hypothetical protein
MASLKGADEVGGLLRSIEAYRGNLIVRVAWRMTPLEGEYERNKQTNKQFDNLCEGVW